MDLNGRPHSFELEYDLQKLLDGDYIDLKGETFRSLEDFAEFPAFRIAFENPKDSKLRERFNSSNPSPEVHANGRETNSLSQASLYTIGYEGKSVDKYFQTLLDNGVRFIVDLRSNPVSRRYGFSKKRLSQIGDLLGIGYENIKALGIPASERKLWRSLDDRMRTYERFRQALPSKKEELDHLKELVDTHGKVVVNCYEADVNICHRRVIRDYMAATYGLEVMDL